MSELPLTFEACSEAEFGSNLPWKSQINSLEPITCCIPPEFKGPGGGYTPEDFLALAVINCIVADFKIFCERQQESFQKIHIKAKLTLNKNSGHQLIFTELDLKIEVTGSTTKEKVKKILEESIQSCPVCHALKTPKTLHLSVT